MSFWGTAVRSLLFAFVGGAAFLLALSETTTAASFDNEILSFLYVLASYFVLDAGYVIAARAYTLSAKLDASILIAADVFLALLYIVPRLVVDSRIALAVNPLLYVIFVPIIVVSLRMLVGLLFGKRGKQPSL